MPLTRSRFVALIALAAAARPLPVRSQTVKVRIGAAPTDSYAQAYYASEGGFFANAGLDVEVLSYASGGQMMTAVASDALDIGVGDPIQAGVAVLRGAGFGFFAGGFEYVTDAPVVQLCVARDGPVKSPKDLTGKTISVFSVRTMPEFATREWLTANGVDPTSVTFVSLGPTAVGPAIARGTIAAGCVTEPDISAGPAQGIVPFAKVFDYCAPSFYVNAWYAKRDWLAANADTARTVAQAMYQTAQWANANHALTVPIIAKYAKLDPAVIARSIRARFDTTLDARRLQPELALAAKYHYLDQPLSADQLIVKL